MENEKIINDPIYGFIKIRKGIISQLIDHPYFQRLSRIKQLGLTYLVYPGASSARHYLQRVFQILRDTQNLCIFYLNFKIELLLVKMDGHLI